MWGVEIGLHGWIALILTIVGVAALNIGLMHLARRRWDHGFDRLETAVPDAVDEGEADRGGRPQPRRDP